MICNGGGQLSSNEEPQFPHEACGKLLSHAVMPLDIPVVELGSAFCVNPGVALNEVCTLTENI
jgi:hypothetical protein